MRRDIKKFVKVCADGLDILDPIFEFGALQVPGQEGFADLRPFFLGKCYVGCDLTHGAGVDRIEDIHCPKIEDQFVGTCLVIDTLEHVESPHRALAEVHRILKPGGIVIISSHMNFPMHSYPFDYWRFTPKAFELLLEKFDTKIVRSKGEPSNPYTVVGVGIKGRVSPEILKSLEEKINMWAKALTWQNKRGKELIRYVLPPFLSDFLRVCKHYKDYIGGRR